MFERFFRQAATALLCVVAAGAQAQISESQAEQLMKLSGQWAQLESLTGQMRSGLLQGLAAGDTPAPAALQERVKIASERAFNVERARQVARRVVAENVRAPYLAELLRWYQTPMAQRITAAEVADTAAPERDMKERVQEGMGLVQAAAPERRQLLLRMVEVTRAPRAGADLLIHMGVMLPLTLARFDPEAKPANEAELRAQLETQRPQLTQAFETISLAGFAIVYKALPDAELAAYNDFMAGSAGEHYNDISERAFEAAILDAVAALKP